MSVKLISLVMYRARFLSDSPSIDCRGVDTIAPPVTIFQGTSLVKENKMSCSGPKVVSLNFTD